MNETEKIQTSIEHLLNQRRTFQTQLTEIDNALEAITEEDTYKIIGNIMVKRSAQSTKKELEEKKEILNVRVQTLEKQEKKLHEKLKKAQQETMK